MPNKAQTFIHGNNEGAKRFIKPTIQMMKKQPFNSAIRGSKPSNKVLLRMKNKVIQRQIQAIKEKSQYTTPTKKPSPVSVITSPDTPLKEYLSPDEIDEPITREMILTYLYNVLFPGSMNELTNEALHKDEIKEIFYILSYSFEYFYDWNDLTIDTCINEFINNRFILRILSDMKFETSIDLSPRLKVLIAIDKHIENMRITLLNNFYLITLDYVEQSYNNETIQNEYEGNGYQNGSFLLYIGLFRYYVNIIRQEIENEETKMIRQNNDNSPNNNNNNNVYIKPVVPIINDIYKDYIMLLLRQSYIFLKGYNIIINNYNIFIDSIRTLCRIHPFITPRFLMKIYDYWPVWNTQKEHCFIEILTSILTIYSRPVTYHEHYRNSFNKIFYKISMVIKGNHIINILQSFKLLDNIFIQSNCLEENCEICEMLRESLCLATDHWEPTIRNKATELFNRFLDLA